METIKQIDDEIPPMRRGRINTYKPEDIRRWGVERFLEATAVREPFLYEFPTFTDDENRRMDEILAEEKGL